MSRYLIVVFACLLSACAATTLAPSDARALLEDGLFAPRPVPPAAEIFAASPEMKQALDGDMAGLLRRRGRVYGLVEALQDGGPLRLAYDASGTRTAAETFAARSGNCLSLVIMTSTFARELELPVRYYRVHTPDVWTREEDLLVANQHVNLSIGHRLMDRRPGDDDPRLIVDFLPGADIGRQLRSEIDERTLVAMYLNNRAAESVVERELDQAYWLAREAILTAPLFFAAYNTLAIVYRRHGHAELAARVLEYALAVEPENVQVMANLVPVYRQQGRLHEAEEIARRLRTLEPQPPYHYFFMAVAALERREFAAARELFGRELKREPHNHEVHFGLAVTELNLGHLDTARTHLSAAIENSTTRTSRELYAAKLDRLRRIEQQQ